MVLPPRLPAVVRSFFAWSSSALCANERSGGEAPHGQEERRPRHYARTGGVAALWADGKGMSRVQRQRGTAARDRSGDGVGRKRCGGLGRK